jgi:hypothetical protein
MYLGDFTTTQTVYVPFHTFDSNDPQASVTITGLAVTDIEIYKAGSMTQRSSDAGYTLLDTDGIDLDGITGIHGFSIDLSDNTDAGFYATGNDYFVVVSAITVDAATVSFVAAQFSIENRFPYVYGSVIPSVGIIDSGTAQSATSTTCVLKAATPLSADDITNGATLLVYGSTQGYWQQRIITDFATSTDTATVDAFTVTPSGTISYIVIATPPSSTSSPIAANVTQFGGNAGTFASGIPAVNATQIEGSDATDQINAACDTALTDYDAATGTELATAQADLDTITGADGVTLATAQGNYAPSKAGDAMALTAGAVDDVWDEPIAGHLTAGTAGLSEALGSAAVADGTITGTPTGTTFTFTGGNTNDDFYADQLVYILSGTGIGQVRPVLHSTYSGGTTTITVDEDWIVNPGAGARFVVLVTHVHPKTQITADIDANSTQLAKMASGIITGAAATGTLSTTQATSDLTGYADDQLIGRVIIWTSGAADGEATDITDYASASGLLTFTALTTAPGNGDTFKIV